MSLLRKWSYRGLRWWWKVISPITVGVRAILIGGDQQVLLVRHTYQDQWYLPGGGVKKGETLAQAIARESAEEVGASLGEIRLLGIYSNFYEGKSDHVVVFVCDAFSLTGKTDGEIAQLGFFPLDDLPEGTSPGTRRRIREYLQGQVPGVGRW
jgi:8-oxo-dGTP pyrophosphatase MutT (NUDIX family)